MIRAVLQTVTGPLIVLGVVDENLRRLQAGKPIAVDLGDLLVEALRGIGPEHDGGAVRLVIMYGETHAAIVNEMEAGSGQSMPAETLKAAMVLDDQLREEGLL